MRAHGINHGLNLDTRGEADDKPGHWRMMPSRSKATRSFGPLACQELPGWVVHGAISAPISIHFGTSMSRRIMIRRLLLHVLAMLLAAALCCCPVASQAIIEGDQNPVEANNDTTGQS